VNIDSARFVSVTGLK